MLDANKDGVLEPADIEEILERLLKMRKGLFSKAESNHLRYITLKSFDRLLIEAGRGKTRQITILEWVRTIHKNNQVDQESYFIRWFSAAVVRFLFDLFDHNRDGYIDFDEFEMLYKILGLNRGNIKLSLLRKMVLLLPQRLVCISRMSYWINWNLRALSELILPFM